MAGGWNPEAATTCRRRQVLLPTPGMEPRLRGRGYGIVVMTLADIYRSVPVPLWK